MPLPETIEPMSDDRFQQPHRGHNDDFDDDFEDEATALVDVGPSQAPPPFGPPPVSDDTDPGMSIGPGAAGGQSWQQPSQPRSAPPPRQAPPAAQTDSQIFIGDEVGYEGVTQFVNMNEFASDGPSGSSGGGGDTFAPDAAEAGYEGHTQLVDLASIQPGGQDGGHPDAIARDPMLRQGYQFGPESIQHGPITLVFAQNAMGKAVILKRVWEGDAQGMPAGLRQRIAALDKIRHPRLVPLNGMLITSSGAWVELDRPLGYRLTDILQQHGPQPVDDVKRWSAQIAEVLDAVHGHQFIYGNLTTDAVWIQEDGSILLEPFDVLSFEERGNLGDFGAPELSQPPEQRHVWPATDVYSLAALMVAALTGLPLNLRAASGLDKKTAAAIDEALSPDPGARPQTAQGFVEGLDARRGLPEPNIRMAIVAVFVIGSLTVGYLYWRREQQIAAAQAAAAAAAAAEAAPAQVAAELEAGDEPGQGEDTAPELAAAEGMAVEVDPRLKVETSYRLNPPPTDEELAARDLPQGDPEQLRAEARELLEGIDRLVVEQQEARYTEALQKVAAASRASGGPTEADRELLEELYEEERVQKIARDYKEKLNKALEERNMTSLKSVYPKLASIDAEAQDVGFFTRNKSVGVKPLKRQDPTKTSEEP